MLKNLEQTGKNWASPGSQGENLRFFDFPAFYLMSLAGMAKQEIVRNHLAPWGLTMPEWRLLSTVAEASPVRFSRVAQITAMDKAQVSRALRTAQGKGLVESSVLAVDLAQGHGRPLSAGRVHVSITAAGRALYDQVMPAVQRAQLELLELMTPEERHVVIRLARRLLTRFREAGAGTAAPSPRGEAGEVAVLRQAG